MDGSWPPPIWTNELLACLTSQQRRSILLGIWGSATLQRYGLLKSSAARSTSLIIMNRPVLILDTTSGKLTVSLTFTQDTSFHTTPRLGNWERARLAWKFWKALA